MADETTPSRALQDSLLRSSAAPSENASARSQPCPERSTDCPAEEAPRRRGCFHALCRTLACCLRRRRPRSSYSRLDDRADHTAPTRAATAGTAQNAPAGGDLPELPAVFDVVVEADSGSTRRHGWRPWRRRRRQLAVAAPAVAADEAVHVAGDECDLPLAIVVEMLQPPRAPPPVQLPELTPTLAAMVEQGVLTDAQAQEMMR